MTNDASFLVLFLAPVKEYLADDQVSEILINGPDRVYIERGGKLQETDAAFASEAQLKAAAVNIAKSVERHDTLSSLQPSSSDGGGGKSGKSDGPVTLDALQW